MNLLDGIYGCVYGDDRIMNGAKEFFSHYERMFRAENWEVIVKVLGDDQGFFQLMILSTPQVLYGLFVIVWNYGELILFNIVDDMNLEMARKVLEDIDLHAILHGHLDLYRHMRGEEMEQISLSIGRETIEGLADNKGPPHVLIHRQSSLDVCVFLSG